MYYRKLFFLLISFNLTVYAQIINLHGKVSDQTGTPVPGAIVALSHHELKDTTNDDGTFSLTETIVTALPSSKTETDIISFNNGSLEFHLTHPSSIKVEIYSLKGRLLKKKFTTDITTGVCRFNITDNCSAANLLIVHASAGIREMTFRYLPLHNAVYALTTTGSNFIPVVGKKSSTAPVIDTLTITAPGYISAAVALTTYDTIVDVTFDTMSGISGNWRLERATCTSERSDNCRVELQLCPSFYCFSESRLTKYESSYEVMCTVDWCDTTLFCHDTLTYDFQTIKNGVYIFWDDTVKISFKNDTLLFKREMTNVVPRGTRTYYFVKESQPVPYCSKECVESPF